MPSCKECKNYFPIPDEYLPDIQKSKSDEGRYSVLMGRNARQEYWTAKPVAADMDAS